RIAAVLSKHPHGLHAARLSSGRFALVLECQTVAHLRSIARELYSALNAQTFKANHGALRLQASIGGLQIDSGIVSTSEDVLLSLSDAMAIAASVRVPQLFVEPLTHAIIDARRSHQSKIEHIRTAIRGNYLEVHAQPILDPKSPPAKSCYE
ncbi:MAG: hypothetical protein VW339_09765, partial [Quisquiliibacterium sp.]